MHETLQPRSDRIDALAGEVAECLIRRRVASDLSWREEAACTGVDPEVFFPQRGEATSRATSICGSCPVRVECLTWSLLAGETRGIWGGVAERTRRVLRRRLPRMQAAAAAYREAGERSPALVG